MKVCVLGLWHLGTVTAACLASGGHDVIGSRLRRRPSSQAFRPVSRRSSSPASKISSRPASRAAACASRPTPPPPSTTPTSSGSPTTRRWTTTIGRTWSSSSSGRPGCFRTCATGALVLISSQVPVGTTRQLEQAFASASRGRTVGFGYSPENLRLGKAIDAFTQPDRVVVGVRSPADRERVAALLRPFTERIEWMSVESAEMTKHALNAFLATSVTFINEIAALCEQVGADATEVERGLKSEARIGPKAYSVAGRRLRRRHAGARRRVPLAARPGARRGDAPAVVGQVEQRRAPPVGAATPRAAARRRRRARRSPSGASPTSRAPTRSADRAPSSCASGWSSRARSFARTTRP